MKKNLEALEAGQVIVNVHFYEAQFRCHLTPSGILVSRSLRRKSFLSCTILSIS